MSRFNDGLLASRKSVTALVFTVLVAACSDPAPGEGVDGPVGEAPMPEVVSASEAVRTPSVSEIDPATMQEAEIDKVVPSAPRCSFSYTAESPPILTASMSSRGKAIGVIKIHGRLVQVTAPEVTSFESLADGALFSAGNVTVEVHPEEQGGDRRHAEAHFKIGSELTVGYRGWYSCSRSR